MSVPAFTCVSRSLSSLLIMMYSRFRDWLRYVYRVTIVKSARERLQSQPRIEDGGSKIARFSMLNLPSSIFDPRLITVSLRFLPTPDLLLFASARRPSTPPSRSPYISRPLYDGPADVNRFLEYRPAASRSLRRLAAPPFALRAIATS